MPKTKLGKFAVGFITVFFLAVLIAVRYRNLGHGPGDPYLVIPGICAAISGIAAFVAAAVSFFKLKDRSILVGFTMIVGSLVILGVLMEVVEGIIYRLSH